MEVKENRENSTPSFPLDVSSHHLLMKPGGPLSPKCAPDAAGLPERVFPRRPKLLAELERELRGVETVAAMAD